MIIRPRHDAYLTPLLSSMPRSLDSVTSSLRYFVTSPARLFAFMPGSTTIEGPCTPCG